MNLTKIRMGFEITPSIKEKLIILAKCVGVSLNWKRPLGYAWDGKDISCATMDASNIIHDIAHYAVATKNARKCIDFGLGLGPDSEYILDDQKIEILYSDKVKTLIEERASALGIHWEKKLGLPFESTLRFHQWDKHDIQKYWKNLRHTIGKYSLKGFEL